MGRTSEVAGEGTHLPHIELLHHSGLKGRTWSHGAGRSLLLRTPQLVLGVCKVWGRGQHAIYTGISIHTVLVILHVHNLHKLTIHYNAV